MRGLCAFFFSSRRRHTRSLCDWSSDVCSSDLTLQLGDPAVIAERVGIRVVSDFRARDVAAGGQGAPLVPLADVLLFGHPERGRLLLNIGGIANVTYAPRLGVTEGALAFDTGPGVAVVEAVTRRIDPSARF